MPRRLILMRHATANGSAEGGDAERALTERGLAEANRVGQRLARDTYRPDRVLCSTARRCRETWGEVSAAWGEEDQPTVEFLPRLYNAPPARLLEAILDVASVVEEASATDSAGTLLLIAHNPGISLLAYELGRGDPDQEAALGTGFAPASTAVFEIEVEETWASVGSGRLRLIAAEDAKDAIG